MTTQPIDPGHIAKARKILEAYLEEHPEDLEWAAMMFAIDTLKDEPEGLTRREILAMVSKEFPEFYAVLLAVFPTSYAKEVPTFAIFDADVSFAQRYEVLRYEHPDLPIYRFLTKAAAQRYAEENEITNFVIFEYTSRHVPVFHYSAPVEIARFETFEWDCPNCHEHHKGTGHPQDRITCINRYGGGCGHSFPID